MDEIIINGKKYVEAGAAPAEKLDDMPYCIIRTYSAGVFAGYVQSREGKEAVIRKARCLYYWDGAATLMQLAKSGVTQPNNCKFTVAVDEVTVTEAIEIIPCTLDAQLNIAEVPEWKV